MRSVLAGAVALAVLGAAPTPPPVKDPVVRRQPVRDAEAWASRTTRTEPPPPTTTTTTVPPAPPTTVPHVHPPPPPAPAPPPVAAVPPGVWDRLAQCESGGDWSINTGNGYSGGLQWHPDTWRRAGGTRYAPYAWQATREQEIAVAEGWLARTSWDQWPACARSLGLR